MINIKNIIDDLNNYNDNDIYILSKYLNTKNNINNVAKKILQLYNFKKLDHKLCSNSLDLITMDEWNDFNKPNLILNVYKNNKKISTECYNRTELINYLNLPTNSFTKWIPIKDKDSVQSNGYNSMPSTNPKHYVGKIYSNIGNIYIKKDANFNKLLMDSSINKWNLEYVKKIKIGSLNPQAFRQIGALHGQEPGEDIYKLVLYGDKNEKENIWTNRILSLITDDDIELFSGNVDEIIDSIVIQLQTSFSKENIPIDSINNAKSQLTQNILKKQNNK